MAEYTVYTASGGIYDIRLEGEWWYVRNKNPALNIHGILLGFGDTPDHEDRIFNEDLDDADRRKHPRTVYMLNGLNVQTPEDLAGQLEAIREGRATGRPLRMFFGKENVHIEGLRLQLRDATSGELASADGQKGWTRTLKDQMWVTTHILRVELVE